MDVSEPASISAAIAGRYATAIFELAQEGRGLDALEADVKALGEALAASADLRDLIASPIYTRPQQEAAIEAVAKPMGLSLPMQNGLALMATKRRLFVLPQLLKQLSALIAEAKGEVTADVTSAAPLSAEQQQALSAALAQKSGKIVKLNVAVDESLIGGMIVRLGSQMIDTSVRAKLASLQNTMKEVG
ncbi:F0F1 ATP synthase subunit delta [Paenirhodobacter populi]|uniref:ATP synthase subunit delta n=1 Tax=Paenirhodobacter populi TaxID=2306993 RepID=A0A443IQW3_9RHOB|nr:F0F1 ATP synthase subunit delta [Sinirhodobacter populi]RWR08560.1 F0F1 ATP synthase subunit delta [Sinirhodobacter populi]RWR17232.1 F0F1 ATP synthase subunit delta [Sinirhodobacter populi]RWR29659.1 F0F1 ATP synthase subunit delta [Sinirhodobacter populi]RWR34041.1 F0F1 ATP synthase subunit delta [Sinirhodobacter populi]